MADDLPIEIRELFYVKVDKVPLAEVQAAIAKLYPSPRSDYHIKQVMSKLTVDDATQTVTLAAEAKPILS